MCNTRKLRSKTWNTAEKKLFPILETITLFNTIKQNRSCNQFLSFMSEPYLSSSSMTCMHLKKFKVFSNFPGPETHFRHAQGHQQACPLVGSTYIFHSTFNTVFEVVHQKTVNTKLGKYYLAFGSNQRLFHYFQEKTAGRHKKTESKVALHS